MRFISFLGAAALALLLPLLAHAQTNGLISGTVTDKSGATVVGAQVVITNAAGNLTRTMETNSDGVYVASSLPSGTYDITVTAAGFQKFEAKGVVLEVAQKARVDVALTVGKITEEVVVTGEDVARVDTQSSEIGTTVTGKQVDQLELNGRNFTQLVTLAPGVINQTGQDEGTVGVAGNIAYSINGGRTEYNNWELDGGDNMDNGSNATLNVYPSLEAISEFKVLTSNYGAQYGKNGSGTIEVETKSGTNQWHGSAYEYLRNDFFNANSWFDNGNGIARPAYKKHDFGYTFGGPVYIPKVYNNGKKKTFFFWSQEWRREIVPGGAISQAVPSDQERAGNFNDVCPAYTGASFDPTVYTDCPSQPGQAGVPFVNNTVPTPFSSTASALLSLIPKANNLTGVVGTYQTGQAAGTNLPAYVANPSYPTHWREELIRIDHNLTENERLTFRYIHDSWGTVNQGPLWGVYNNTFDNTNTNFVGPTTSFVTRLTSNISSKLLNEFVASYTADHIFLTELSNVSLPSGGIDLAPLFPSAFNNANKIPAFSIGNTPGTVYGTNGFSVDTGYFPWKNANPTYTYRDIMTAILGKHTFFFGAYVAFAQKNQQSSEDIQGQLTFATNNPNSTNNPFADMLLGQVGGYAQTSAQPYFYDRYKIFEPFFQDDWRITKKLTLNLGLRWSFYGRYQEKQFKEFNFDPGVFATPSTGVYLPFTGTALLQPGVNQFNGFEQCGAPSPTVSGIPVATTGCMKNKYKNPGPRFGFAYDPRGDGRTAIRGGYGIFFEHMNGNEANAESLQGNPSPLVLNGAVSNIQGYTLVGAGTQGAPSPFGATSIPNQVQWPYMQQWNLGVEHELPAHVVLSVAYVGSKGTHLTRQYDLNQLQPVPASQNPYLASHLQITDADCQFDPTQPNYNWNIDPTTGLPISAVISNGAIVTGQAAQNLFVACGSGAADYYRPYQGMGSITRIENTANSIYHSLQVNARRSLGDLTVSASYTWSHAIDDSSDRYDSTFVNSYDLGAYRASSNFDTRHSFSLSYVYALPIFRHSSGLTHTLLGGWQWSGITVAQTGVPFSVGNGSVYADNAGVANGVGGLGSFPDVVGNPNVVPAAVQQAFQAQKIFGKLLYNPTAFDIPVGLTFGDATRNMLRAPGRLNFDMGLFKRFEFREHYAFEFRWETFNTFNHTQLDSFSGTNPGGSGGAGGVVSMGCSPVAALAAGNDPTCGGFLVLNDAHLPRIMQFALRFQF